MKQFTIVLDGIADRPQERLGGRTPMEAAQTPGLDALFAAGKPGTVRTIPPGLGGRQRGGEHEPAGLRSGEGIQRPRGDRGGGRRASH